MALTDFGIAHRESLTASVIGATPITENIAESLLAIGINPDDVNKLVLPSGLSNVGHLTILTPLLDILDDEIQDWVSDILVQPAAVCGFISFPLSRRFDVLARFSPQFIVDESSTRRTLAVVRFYDIRNDYAIDSGFGVLPTGSDNDAWNTYNSDWSLSNHSDPDEDEEEGILQYGMTPYEALDRLGIFATAGNENALLPPVTELEKIWQELDDPLNMRDDISKPASVLHWADAILTNCGLVALPWTTPRGSDDYPELGHENDTDFSFRLAYIGDGANEACVNWSSLSQFYNVGSLAVATGELKNQIDLWSEGDSPSQDAIEDMLKWDFFPTGDGVLPCEHTSWLGYPLDVSNGMHDRFSVAFPMKDIFTGEIGEVVCDMQHGIPEEYLRQGDYNGEVGVVDDEGKREFARNPFGVTDHLKTRWLSGSDVVYLDPHHEDFVHYCQFGCVLGLDRDHKPPTLCEENNDCEDGFSCLNGVCVFEGEGESESESCEDYCETYEETELERAPTLQELVARAMELSRRFYARYYSGVGNIVWHLHHPVFPWAGCSTYEWGYKNDKPYTAAFGKIDNPLFGFQTPSIGSDLTVTGDMVAMSRPDGTLNLEIINRRGKAVLCQITRADNRNLGRPKYDIRMVDTNMRAYSLKGLRPLGQNLFHQPAEVGSYGTIYMGEGFAFRPTEEQLNNFGENNTPYALHVEEGVATASCQSGLGAGGGISGFRGTRGQETLFPDKHMLDLHYKIREIHGL